MRAFFLHYKTQAIITLVLLILGASSQFTITTVGYLFFSCVGGAVISDLLFTYIRRRKIYVSKSSIISGLILTLIIEPSAPWYQILLIATAAMAIKNFLRFANRHIFNPAASGLLIGFVLFGLFPSWWAPTLYNANFFSITNLTIIVPILLFAYISCFRLKRYISASSYLIVSLGLQILISSGSFTTAVATIISPGTLFYAFVMLVEPMTSPIQKNRQMLYGIFVAAFSFFLVFISGATSIVIFDASLIALLLGNLLFYRFR